MGVPPTPRVSLPRLTPDEDTTRVARHPVLLRAVRHKHPTRTPRAGLGREPPVPFPVLPRVDLPDLTRPRADLPPHTPVVPLPPAVVPL